MKVVTLSEMNVGDLLIRRSAYVDMPVVVTKVEDGVLRVGLRPEDYTENLGLMTLGMMDFGVEGSPVQMVKNVGWDYDIATGEELNPSAFGQSILLKDDG